MEADQRVSRHTAFVYDRGGTRRIAQIHDLSLVRWGRVRDDISEAKLILTEGKAESQRDVLRAIEPGRHELVLFRNEQRCWEGPFTTPTFKGSGGVELNAKDVMHYVHFTVMHAAYSSKYPNIEKVVARAKRILIAELARKEAIVPPYNIVPFIRDYQFATDAGTAASTEAMEMTVFEHIDNMAATKGMDYTVVGRSIHLWDTSRPAMGTTRTLTEADFLGDVYVTVYGAELATRTISTDGQGLYGVFGGVDPYYGEWERLSTAYDENDADAERPSVAELQSQAKRNYAGRNPTPLQVRVPDNSSLILSGTLTIDSLVPGVYMPLRAKLNVRDVSQMQKLQKVTVEETSTGETIKVTLYPATAADVEPAP